MPYAGSCTPHVRVYQRRSAARARSSIVAHECSSSWSGSTMWPSRRSVAVRWFSVECGGRKFPIYATLMRAPYLRGSESERFWPKVERTETCWVWTAAIRPDGYGVFRRADGTNIRAHRWAYEDAHGSAPPILDHVCRNRRCVRPDHLEPVTHEENARRSIAGRRVWRRERTHCKNGHAFDETTTRIYRGQRLCRACRNEQDRARRARRR